jgi:hypothetical protein
MFNVSSRTFILVIDGEIDSTTKDWNDMRDYCSETGKQGDVFLLESKIPLGGSVNNISTSTSFFGKI